MKPKLYFVHCRNFANTGDMMSCPFEHFKSYFEENFDCRFVDISDRIPFNYDEITKDDYAIIGGGGLDGYHEGWQQKINNVISKVKVAVGWGFGSNRNPQRSNIVDSKLNLNALALFGIRDAGESFGRYVPCVSCIGVDSSLLQTKPTKQCGVIMHLESIIHSKSIPQNCDIIANSQDLKAILKFIAEHEFIISNSYHICYWAMLLQRPVYRLYGVDCDSRYNLFEYDIPNWSGHRDLSKEIVVPRFLDKCKRLNLEFFEEVKTIFRKQI